MGFGLGMLKINMKPDYINDKTLSWGAKGMLTYFLIKKDFGMIPISELIKSEEDEKIFNELIKSGNFEVTNVKI